MKSKVFIINLVLAIGVLILFVWLGLKWLDSNTRHGEELAAPNFYGVHMDDLEEFSKSGNVRYKIIDSIYSDEHAKGTVVRQDPLAHADDLESYVKPDRTFYLTVIKKSVELKAIPDLSNNSKKLAVNRLQILGFNYDVKAVPSEFEDLVLRVTYEGKEVTPGMKIPKGSKLLLEVGKGQGGAPTAVPNLRGNTIAEAKLRLQNVSLFLDFQCDDCLTKEDSINAKIYRQVPGAVSVENSTVREGSDIVVFASIKQSPDGAPSTDTTAVQNTPTP